MLFLLDANVLIEANRKYYSLDRVPEFWEWLIHVAAAGQVKMPIETFEEIAEGKDDLAIWASREDVREAIVLAEEVNPSLVAHVLDLGYAADLTDDEVEKVGRDPFLIAHALVNPRDRCVVTTEASKPSRQRANRHVPDVCSQLGVGCVNTFDLVRTLDFRTGWSAT
ncbi:MAG: DUF4411 family protein [bacterium]|nr:DUF4411 family protein [bacterium]